MLGEVANAAADPHHVKAREADSESGHDVEPPIPAMKGGNPVADLRNQLKQSGEDDCDRRDDMDGNREVAHGIAGDDPMRDGFAPGDPISAQGGQAVEGRYFKREEKLADDGHGEPEADGGFQGAVGYGSQV